MLKDFYKKNKFYDKKFYDKTFYDKKFSEQNLYDKILYNITSVPTYAKVVMNSRAPTEPVGLTMVPSPCAKRIIMCPKLW